MRLRQIAFVAEHLEPALHELCAVLGETECYRDPNVGRWGLENVLVPIGGNFLEIVSPKEPGTSAGRFLQRRGGDGGYMVILQGPDALAARRHIMEQGVRVVAAAERPDYVYTHFHPADTGHVLLSIESVPGADYREELSEWPPAGPSWRQVVGTEGTLELRGVELQGQDPAAMAALWSRLLGLPVTARAGQRYEIVLDNATISFVRASDGRGPGVGGITVHAVHPGKV
ncbi:MAG TPA: VOC family protein, partial [bacterium]|nr:VOC family protein [bacterium]